MQLPDEMNKPVETNNDTYESRQKQNFTIVGNMMHKNQSPSNHNENNGLKPSNKPVIAKDNFVLAHKNLIPGV